MNERDMEFLTAAFTKYYGRLDQATIDVLELVRGYDKSQFKATNPFLAYAVTEKSDTDLRKDECPFPALLMRINRSIESKEESMTVDSIFSMIDKDGDGMIGVEDVLAMNCEIGSRLEEEEVGKIMEQISEEGTRLNKQEFARVFWK